MSSRTSPARQLYRSFKRCEGERLLQRLRELEQPHGLLQANMTALRASLPQNSIGGLRLPLADVPLGGTERKILREFERALHALFASTATLDASMRTLATSAPRSRALFHSYEAERSRLSMGSPALGFADQLRDLVLTTGRVPWITSYRDTGTLDRVDLYRDGLRRLRVWHGTARDFIRGPGPDIDPQALMEAHASMWSALYEWFVRRAKAMHRAELDERRSLWDQLGWDLHGPGEEES